MREASLAPRHGAVYAGPLVNVAAVIVPCGHDPAITPFPPDPFPFMSDAPRYWTPAFVERFVEAINQDDAFQKTAASFSDTIELRCFDTPDGEDVAAAYAFEDGKIVDVDLWIDDAPSGDMREEPFDKSAMMARATAPYTMWVKMDQGEIGAMQALTSPDYTIDGSTIKIMSNMGVFRGLNEVAAKIDKTY